jgi:hypothetical protein
MGYVPLMIGYFWWLILNLYIGITSNEPVKVPTRGPPSDLRTPIYGFNSEEPFFTVAHVFYTTIGLRALDPRGARVENEWPSVGRLAARD